MIEVRSGESYEVRCWGFPSGLTGIFGIELRDNIGGITVPRTTMGIIEDPAGSGSYTTTRTAPIVAAGVIEQFSEFWDTGVISSSTTAEESLVVYGAGIPMPSPPPPPGTGPVLGPCQSWITGEDVALCCPATGEGSSGEGLDDVAATASMILFELSARQFSGVCGRTVRPCRTGCGCFGSGVGISWGWSDSDGHWLDECGDGCGCSPLSVVRLDGYPVREILEVLIDGVSIEPTHYRLDDWRDLVYMSDPGPPVTRRYWPSCQDLSLDSDQPGTFEVTYSYGVDPPQIGKDAAAALACELWNACPENGGKCRLPGRVTKVVRQGVTYDAVGVLAALIREGATGIVAIDLFVGTYNPNGLRRRPAVWSPDVPEFPRRVGT